MFESQKKMWVVVLELRPHPLNLRRARRSNGGVFHQLGERFSVTTSILDRLWIRIRSEVAGTKQVLCLALEWIEAYVVFLGDLNNMSSRTIICCQGEAKATMNKYYPILFGITYKIPSRVGLELRAWIAISSTAWSSLFHPVCHWLLRHEIIHQTNCSKSGWPPEVYQNV